MSNAVTIPQKRKRDGFAWSEAELYQAKSLIELGTSFEEMGVILHRSKDAVATRMNMNGYGDPGGGKGRWTEEQVSTLTAMWYAKKDLATMAAAIGKDESAVKNKASKMGLPGRFTPEFQKGRKGAMQRKCMCCGNLFHSTHIGNRLCGKYGCN